MKNILKLLLIVILLIFTVFLLLYYLYFDSLCGKYSGYSEYNTVEVISILAICKDNLVCEPTNIESDKMNQVKNWECNKVDFPIFTKEFYIEGINNFNNRMNK